MPDDVTELVDHLFRRESGRLTAALTRIFGMSRADLVEDVVQEALISALRHWRFNGVPENPAAWLTQVARRKAIDSLRREATHRRKERALAAWADRDVFAEDDHDIRDEQLRLMFACCHPRLPREQRVALTLRLLCGFGVPEIARAFLISHQAAAQRLVRAKRMVRDEEIAMEPPEGEMLESRLEGVIETIYLMFNEGYAAHGGDRLIRREFVEEACRLAGLLLSDERTARPIVHALLALMLFATSRLDARTDEDGAIILLDAQDRSQWDQTLIQRGFHHLQRAMGGGRVTTWHLEAAIAACHARAASFEETDWLEIVSLYDMLREINASPVVALNRAAAIAMAHGPEAGLAELDALTSDGRLNRYYLLPAARGEILARAERHSEAAEAFRAALALECSLPERLLLQRRLARSEGV